jgi:hypothetical protein
MKKFVVVLLGGLILLLMVPIVSAGEPRCVPTLNAPTKVVYGTQIYFKGFGTLHGGVTSPLAGNEIQIYKSSTPLRKPILIGTTITGRGGIYSFKYTAEDTAYYQAVCVYKGNYDGIVTSWHSQWVKVGIRFLRIPYVD